jgi:glycosyltransferase involved in cell wall biosynthesis
MRSLARSASTLVVPSNAARQALAEVFGIAPDTVMVIPHGSSWRPAEIGASDRRQVLTWGLLGPGKGIERAILAIASLGDLEVPPVYRVVGQMHPNVVRRQGYAYRDSLLGLIGDTGLESQIELDLEYKSDAELYRLVAASDVVVVPYDNGEQICSGVLTDAITAGRPVVATNFPHARELLAGGAGFVVGHDHPEALGAALRRLLTDDLAYQRAVAQARRLSRRLSWSDVARRYDQVLRRVTNSLAAG